MTDQHPLTDELLEEKFAYQWDFAGLQPLYYDHSMRAAYDLAIEHYSKWIYENGDEYVIQHYENNIKTDLETIVADFKQAMRPQEDK